MVVPLNHPFIDGFPIINHPFLGISHLWNPPYIICYLVGGFNPSVKYERQLG